MLGMYGCLQHVPHCCNTGCVPLRKLVELHKAAHGGNFPDHVPEFPEGMAESDEVHEAEGDSRETREWVREYK
jgi:hypothetical protein